MIFHSHAQQKKERESLIERRSVYQGKILSLRLDIYRIDHATKTAEIVDHPNAVVLVPVDPQNRILLVQQWRRAAQEITIELPAGIIEPGENPLACAQR